MPFKIILYLIFQYCLFLQVSAGINPTGSIQKTSFQNKSFINTKDFANSPLGPTLSSQKANPALYNKPQSFGPPPPPPPPPVPLDNGFILLIGGIVVTGSWYLLKKFRLRPHV